MGYCKMTLTLDSDLDFIYHERSELNANYDRDRNYSKKKNSFRVFSSVSSMDGWFEGVNMVITIH